MSDRTEISELGEFGLIDRITSTFTPGEGTIKGIGDDAAVFGEGELKTVLSTDMLVEGIHFDMMYTPLKHLGYKSVVVNLSDIYAMNATPKHITVSLAISNRFSVEALEEVYAGVQLACDTYGVDLIGGDTTSSLSGLVISVTAVGVALEKDIVYRSTAKPGDLICVTGDLGGSYLGLQMLEREKQIYLEQPEMQPELDKFDYMVGRLLKPEAREDIIKEFAKEKLIPTSMIDISDGLASEIMHICKQSNVGAIIEESGVPIKQECEMLAIDLNFDPITVALSGGEDYELLFTVDPADIEKVRFMADIYIAGEITEASEGVKLHTKGGNIHDMKAQGWKHFEEK